MIIQRKCPLKTFLFEPDAALIKTGLTTTVANKYVLTFINPKSDYLTSDDAKPNFPGRIFRVITTLPWKKRVISSYLKSKNIKKANITRRAFPQKPNELKKKFNITDGGSDYLVFTTLDVSHARSEHSQSMHRKTGLAKTVKKVCIHCTREPND